MSISDPPRGQGPGTSIKPENTINTAFFVCFDTHLLSGHCRASTVSIIDAQGLGGVSRRPRDAPAARGCASWALHFSRALGSRLQSLADAHEGLADVHDARLGGGGGVPRGRKRGKYRVFCVLREKLFKNSSLWLPCMHAAPNLGESMVFLEQTLVSSCFGRVFRDFRPPPPSR